MQRNTATTLAELNTGDRFHYPGKTEVWQMIETKYKVALVNEVHGNDFKNVHPLPKKKDTTVIFLRSTIEAT